MEDGKEISKAYHRHILNPGDDVLEQDERSQQIANAVWTPEVISAFEMMVDSQI